MIQERRKYKRFQIKRRFVSSVLTRTSDSIPVHVYLEDLSRGGVRCRIEHDIDDDEILFLPMDCVLVHSRAICTDIKWREKQGHVLGIEFNDFHPSLKCYFFDVLYNLFSNISV